MQKCQIKRALVAMIGIGHYDDQDGIFGHLQGIPTDYRNMIKLFVNHWGYSFIYQTDDNKIEYLSKSKLLKKDKKYSTNFKLKWNDDDLTKFVESVKKTILSTEPDSLIFIISSHGDSEQVIIDSNLEEYSLIEIYSQFWNQKYGCPYLSDKPKLFFVDACRGIKKPIPKGLMMKKLKTKGNSKLSQIIAYYDVTEKNNQHENSKTNDSKTNDSKTKDSKTKDSRLSSTFGRYDKKYLQYENFCYVYGNLDEYSVVDGGIAGGYLIRAIKSVLAQKNADTEELNKLIKLIGAETLRKVKGELKQKDKNYKTSNSPARQIIQYTSNIQCQVYFSKRENL